MQVLRQRVVISAALPAGTVTAYSPSSDVVVVVCGVPNTPVVVLAAKL